MIPESERYVQYNENYSASLPTVTYDIVCNESKSNKPQMAHEIYERLLIIASSKNSTTASATESTTTSKMSQSIDETQNNDCNKPINKDAILIAAYIGCNLMYRHRQS